MPFVQRLLSIEPPATRHSDRLCGLASSGQVMAPTTTSDAHVSDDVLRFVQVCRLLSRLIVHADDMFSELAAECRHVLERTDRLNDRLRSGLADSVARLDAKTARRPNRTLSAALCSDGSTTSSSTHADFHACYGYSCRLLTPSTRPNSVHQLYAAADRNPCPSIAACDRYRDDGLSGINIFSPCLTLQSLSTSGCSDDVDSYCGGDEPSAVKLLRSVSAVSSLTVVARTPTRIRTPHLSAINEHAPRDDSDVEKFHETKTNRNEEFAAPPPGVVVSVDVTGSSFRKDRRLPLSIADANRTWREDVELDAESSIGFEFSLVRRSLRRVASNDSTKRRLCSSVSDLKNASAIRSRSRRLEIYAPISTSTPASPSRARPTTVRQLKKRSRPATAVEDSGLCSSWRHSLCTTSQSLDDDSTDLWAESRPSSAASAPSRPRKISLTTAGLAKTVDKSPLFRSQSLPRSFKNSLPIPLRRLLSSRTIASTKDDVGSGSVGVVDESVTATGRIPTDEQDKEEESIVVRVEVSESSRNVDAIVSKKNEGSSKKRSESLERVPNRRSFRRRSLPRIVSTGAQNFTVTPTGRDRSLVDNREVHVEIPDQPWTKPFATVKLRPYANHVDDTESRRSSSGHWSGESMSVCPSADRDSFNPTVSSLATADIPSYSDTDSAVSLPIHCKHRKDNSRQTVDSRLHDSVNGDGTDTASSFGDSTIEDQLSVFSVDQDGFFTSMHADSGLAVTRRQHGGSTTTLVADASDDNDASSTCSPSGTAMTNSTARDEATCRIKNEVFDDRMSYSASISSQKSVERSSSPTASQLSGSSSTVSADDVPTTDGVQGAETSAETSAERPTDYGAHVLPVRRSHSDSGSATAFLSLITITPPGSDDEEDGDLLTWRSEWQRQSTTTKIGGCEPIAAMSTPPLADEDASVAGYGESFDTTNSRRNISDFSERLTIPRVVKKSNNRSGDVCIGSDVGFSTWPCSPVLKFDGEPVRSILKSSSSNQKVTSEKITFNGDSFVDSLGCADDVSSHAGHLAEVGSKHRLTRVSFLSDTNEQDTTAQIHSSPNSFREDVGHLPGRTVTPSCEEGQRCGSPAAMKSDSATRTISWTPSSSTAHARREPLAVCARLVVSTPIAKQSSYAENYHRRMVCRRVTHDELAEISFGLDPVDRCSSSLASDGIFGELYATGSVGACRRSRARVRREPSAVGSRGMTSIRESPELHEPISPSSGEGACWNGSPSSKSSPSPMTTTFCTGNGLSFVGPDGADMFRMTTSSRPSPKSCSRCGGEVIRQPAVDSQKWTRRRDSTTTTTRCKAGKYSASKETESVMRETCPIKRSGSSCSAGTTTTGIGRDLVAYVALKSGKDKAGKTKRSFMHQLGSDSFRTESPLGDPADGELSMSCCLTNVDDSVGDRTRSTDDSFAMIESLVADLSQMSSSNDVSDCSEQLTRSTESVSSTTSAASEQRRVAKLAFFGLDSDSGDGAATNPAAPMVTSAAAVNSFQLPMFASRSAHCSDSCSSSSGLGSSVSASPMESPNSDCSTSECTVPLRAGHGRRLTPCTMDPEATQLFAPASAEHRRSEPSVTATTGFEFKRPYDPAARQSTKAVTIAKQTAL